MFWFDGEKMTDGRIINVATSEFEKLQQLYDMGFFYCVYEGVQVRNLEDDKFVHLHVTSAFYYRMHAEIACDSMNEYVNDGETNIVVDIKERMHELDLLIQRLCKDSIPFELPF